MNPPPTSRRVTCAVLAAALLVAAFLAGRLLPAGQPSADGANRSHGETRMARPPRLLRTERTWDQAWKAATTAERTLAVLESVERCESRDDFLAAIASIQTGADKSEKQRFLALLFADWLETDSLAALSEVRRVESLRHQAGRVAESFHSWAALNPGDAADLLRQVLDGRQTDPEGKPPFLDGIDPPEFLLSIASGLGLSDPSLAASTLARATGSPARTASIEALLQNWYSTDPGAVRRWASSITEQDTRHVALAAAATKAGQQDELEPALAWATSLPDPEDQKIALQALTSQWSRRHAADAYAWCGKLPDGDLKFSLMPDVLRQLTIIDPGAAADWLNQYGPAPEMDASIAAYAKGILFTNPAAALGSADAITDPQLRQAVIRRFKRKLRQRGLPDDSPPE